MKLKSAGRRSHGAIFQTGFPEDRPNAASSQPGFCDCLGNCGCRMVFDDEEARGLAVEAGIFDVLHPRPDDRPNGPYFVLCEGLFPTGKFAVVVRFAGFSNRCDNGFIAMVADRLSDAKKFTANFTQFVAAGACRPIAVQSRGN